MSSDRDWGRNLSSGQACSLPGPSGFERARIRGGSSTSLQIALGRECFVEPGVGCPLFSS
jgi:hypothetical protein